MTQEEKAKNKSDFIDKILDYKINLDDIYGAADTLFKNGTIERKTYIWLIDSIDKVCGSLQSLQSGFINREDDAAFCKVLTDKVGF